MKGVRFDGLHSYYEWGLILQEKTIESPKPKINTVEIEGADGVLDYTEFFGDVKFENRQLSFKFIKAQIILDGFLSLYSLVQDMIQGRKMQVVLDDDPAYFYLGRVSINEWKSNKNIGEIVIEVDAEPYKYKMAETTVTKIVDGTLAIMLDNSRMPTVPTITASSAMQFVFEGKTFAADAGTFRLPELQLKQGQNIVTVTGSGTVAFRYQEGRL